MSNRVLEYQRIYQSKRSTPLWMRGPRSKLIVYPFYALFTFSCVLAPLYYGSRAVLGKKYD